MDRLLAGLDFVFVYLDDIIIGSRSAAKHGRHLQALFQRLQTAGLVINQEKCVFGVAEVEFLVHHVTAAGVSPIASRVDREWMLFKGVNDTRDKREKFSGIIFFKFFVKSLVVCTLHLKMKFLRIFHFQV